MQYLQQVLFLLSVVVLLVLVSATTTKASAIAKPGCPDKCGNISVPYPFGIGSKDCYLDESFEVTCNHSTNPPIPYYHRAVRFPDLQILNITADYVRIMNRAPDECYNKTTGTSKWSFSFQVLKRPFTYSATRNKFTAIGCDIFAYMPSLNESSGQNSYITGCASFCNNDTFVKHDKISSCLGNNGCCQTSIPTGLETFVVSMKSINTDSRFWEIHSCSYGFIVEKDYYDGFNRPSDGLTHAPVILDWAIGNKTCRKAEAQRKIYSSSYACGSNSVCVNSENGPGYKCKCSPGYRGNPYLRYGCQEIDECKESNGRICPRPTICKNTPAGDYTCDCPPGYHRYGTKGGTRCQHIKTKLPVEVVIPIGIGSGIIFVLLLLLSFWLYRRFQERKQIILKHKNFKKNGGLLMKQKISSHDGGVEKAKIFLIEELEKATENFNQSRILGKGGFGTVYKGMLSDGRIVAIKKSTLVNENQVDQFINEVVILSQVNHRHIVRLLGCCLETHVPLLVYEYVSSGTLSQHLHSEGYVSSISWKDRLRIGSEIAGALAYLHSDASVPIFHRDIKSSNILLDEIYRAKVSDFGLSRTVPIEKTHLTTVAQGTFGYLDPEYYRSSQFTDKSDVYSFGVVLVELITGERAISLVRPAEGTSLVMHFMSALKEDRLFEILEARVVKEADKDEVTIVAKIAKRCLKLNGKKRPLMKEIAASLEKLRKFQEQPWVQPNKLQVEDFLVGETSSRCDTGTIFEVDDYDESNSSLVST